MTTTTVHVLADADDGRWVSVDGVHVFVHDGETLDQAIERIKAEEAEHAAQLGAARRP